MLFPHPRAVIYQASHGFIFYFLWRESGYDSRQLEMIKAGFKR